MRVFTMDEIEDYELAEELLLEMVVWYVEDGVVWASVPVEDLFETTDGESFLFETEAELEDDIDLVEIFENEGAWTGFSSLADK